MAAGLVRVEIAGGIASGKTTLARLLRRTGLAPCLEDFKKNPFIKDFYKNPKKLAFQTEIAFVLQHYHAQCMIAHAASRYCADFSLVLDRAYAKVTLRRADFQVFERVLESVNRRLPPRILLVHLECSAEVELARIRARAWGPEQPISLSYLRALNSMLRKEVSELPKNSKILRIDSEQIDFAHDLRGRREAVRLVQSALS